MSLFAADVATFTRLLSEVTVEGPQRILAEKKDIDLVETMNTRYCLCQARWEDGVFMIGCDYCEDWFHCGCVRCFPASCRS